MATPIQRNLVNKNQEYAAHFRYGDLALPPAKRYAVGEWPNDFFRSIKMQPMRAVTCIDARIDPASAFGIALGDAHKTHDAGGSAHDALRSLVISEQLLGTTEVVLIKHIGYRILTYQIEDMHGVVAKNLGAGGKAELDGLEFIPFENLE